MATKRGPQIFPLLNGETLDLWYDPNPGCRHWALQHKDAEGNQLGPGYAGEASYSHTREQAMDEVNQILADTFRLEAEPVTCPACGGEGIELGSLGSRKHFRCRSCGIDFSTTEN